MSTTPGAAEQQIPQNEFQQWFLYYGTADAQIAAAMMPAP
jgi:hypothetical protein